MLFAGHDTTAAALTLMMRYLKQEPWILQKLRDEQKQVSLLTPSGCSQIGLDQPQFLDQVSYSSICWC